MKRSAILTFVVVLGAFSAFAQSSGPASNGDFTFSLTGATGAIQYNARGTPSSASGQITFQGQALISNEDVDGEGTAGGTLSDVTVTVNVDCLRISGNRAAISGLVSSSSVASYVGHRALLAVEDGGEGVKANRDRFTWGVYRQGSMNWTPEDSEVAGDNGWFTSWFASDAERNDDTPVLFTHGASSIDCKSFPFGSYAFEEVAHGAGNIQVKP